NVPRMPLRRLRSPRDGPTIWPPIAPRVPRPVPPRRASARKADSGTIHQACPRSQAEQAIDAPPATRAAGSGGDRSRPSRTPSRSTARGPNAAVLVPSSVSGAIADGTSFAQRSPRSRSPTAPPGTPPDPPGSRGPGYAPAVPRRAAPPDGRGKDRTEGSDPDGGGGVPGKADDRVAPVGERTARGDRSCRGGPKAGKPRPKGGSDKAPISWTPGAGSQVDRVANVDGSRGTEVIPDGPRACSHGAGPTRRGRPLPAP
ncbi:MAG: hypothetical protein AVDCRST_MAG19-1251, partial [uncultured Thermomicrobiales bacterium]